MFVLYRTVPVLSASLPPFPFPLPGTWLRYADVASLLLGVVTITLLRSTNNTSRNTTLKQLKLTCTETALDEYCKAAMKIHDMVERSNVRGEEMIR